MYPTQYKYKRIKTGCEERKTNKRPAIRAVQDKTNCKRAHTIARGSQLGSELPSSQNEE